MTNKELQFLMYKSQADNEHIDVIVKDETVWVTQKSMS
ncbi:hypothetical protein R078131_01169 [Convivina intestini]|nr:hypothetical protein R078131_01169 [Convivina intestini]